MRKVILLILLLFSFIADSQWVSQVPCYNTGILDIWFINSTTGFGSGQGGKIFRTTNGGINWICFQTGSASAWYYGVHFPSVLTGYTVGSGRVLKTVNSGASWGLLSTSSVSSYELYSVHFINNQTGFISASQGRIFKSTEGGLNWLPTSINGNVLYADVFFIDSLTGYAVSSGPGIVIKTTNAGLSWFNVYTQSNAAFLGIHFPNPDTGFIAGTTPANSTAEILKTTNAGITWQPIYPGFPYFLYDIYFINSNTGYAVGGFSPSSETGLIIKTTNSGLSWFQQQSSSAFNLNAVKFAGNDTGYAVGGSEFNNIGIILKTTNGGVLTSIEPVSNEAPENFSLSQNYPNPFNPVTKIRFQISKSAFVNMVVYDVLGREIAALVNENLQPGTYEADWDAANQPSGVYFYKLSAGNYSETKRMVLVK